MVLIHWRDFFSYIKGNFLVYLYGTDTAPCTCLKRKFVPFIENADEEIKPILNKVYDLYALESIESSKGWFLETSYLESSIPKPSDGESISCAKK
jgi:hypothetical protein